MLFNVEILGGVGADFTKNGFSKTRDSLKAGGDKHYICPRSNGGLNPWCMVDKAFFLEYDPNPKRSKEKITLLSYSIFDSQVRGREKTCHSHKI
jgi:hypothetical protein